MIILFRNFLNVFLLTVESHQVVSANEIKKQILDGGEKTPKDKLLFSIHSFVPDIFHKSKEKVML